MQYEYNFLVCSTVFLFIIAAFYFPKAKLPNVTNKIFTILLALCILNNVFDALSSVVIEQAKSLPLAIPYIVTTLFYICQSLFALFAFIYAYALTSKGGTVSRFHMLFSAFPVLIHFIIIVTNPLTGLLFRFTGTDREYTYGPLKLEHYIITGTYLVLMTVYAIRYHRRLSRNQFISLVTLPLLEIIAVIIQFFDSELLIIGAAAAASVTMLYLSLQNPSDYIDTLTGNFNSLAFTSFCNTNFAYRRHFYFLGMRINDLKRLNTVFGVENCDNVIRDVGRFMRSLPLGGNLFRITSSTLAIVTFDEVQMNKYITEIEKRFQSNWEIISVSVKLSLSISYMEIPRFATSLETILSNMDYCLMKLNAANHATNFIKVDEHIIHEIEHTTAVEAAVKRAIEAETLDVFYQPIYSMKEDRITAAEALVRLTDPILGPISPELFIPLSEKNGQIPKIGQIVLSKVCEFVAANDLRALGINVIDVNLSVVECMQENLSVQIDEMMQKYGVDPHLIHFEITETAASNSLDTLRSTMYQILRNGCEFSLDDYGTGYSNLSSILELPFYMIKLDKSLIWSYEENNRSDVILSHVIQMAKALKMLILAEGIETKDQLNLMSSLGVDFIQGYFFSRPLSSEKFLEFMRKQQQKPPKNV